MPENLVRLPVELALLGLLALLWGSSYLLINIALETIPPVTLVAIRVSVAAVFLCLVMAIRRASLPRDGRTWRLLLVQAFFNSIAAWLVLAWGQQHVAASLASVLNSTSPIFVFFITLLITRQEEVNLQKLVGALLGLFGVVLIIGVDALSGLGKHILGQIAVLSGAMLYGFAAIHGRRFTHISPLATAAGTMLWASAVLLPMSAVIDAPWQLAPSARSLGAALWLGLFSTGIAMILYFRLVRTIGSMGAASQAYLRSSIGVILGMVVLGESLSPIVGLGMAGAILGVAIINIPLQALRVRKAHP